MSHALLNTLVSCPIDQGAMHAMSNRMFRHCAAAALVLVIGLVTITASAADDATEAMKQRRWLSSGWSSLETEMKMTIVEANGVTTIRELRQYALEVANDGTRTINVFLKPKDVAGLAVLTYSHRDGNDDQWLYLPSSQRVKRIASSNRSGSFAGSEFAYEDISGFEVEKYTHSDLRSVQLDGTAVLMVTSVPTYENSGYAKLAVYLDPATYQPHKVEFFNTRGEVLKSLSLSGYKAYAGRSGWRPHKLDMLNHLTGRRTVLEFDVFRPASVDAAAFNSNRLGQVK